jgi:hypothetical protein
MRCMATGSRAPRVGDLVRARPGSELEADDVLIGRPALIIDTRGIKVLVMDLNDAYWVRRDQLEIL